ncbi:MAG: beta-propeller domain-containing protein [Alphaproteobacteria bacterium]|nr:beta-propeller domain-containing protein [Alphaproteobacteria bacterium]
MIHRKSAVAAALAALFLCSGASPPADGRTGPAVHASHATLTAFASDAQLRAYFKRHVRRPPPAMPPPPSAGVTDQAMAAPSAETISATGATGAGSITNNQVSGVDEGDIVKLHDNVLVILRRGRLFTVSLAGGMHPVDSINAYPPGVDARDDWYDEMLIASDRVVVIGYSYSRGGTQINRFHLDAEGHLAFEDAYQLRSNDYYSSRNYASRLIGNTLILYSPRYLPWGGDDPFVALPALRRWTGDPQAGFERISTARQVYLPPTMPDDQIEAVHTVTFCDLTTPVLACKANSVLGPDGRVFYVAQDAVYVWVTPYWGHALPQGMPTSYLYRLPLDATPPQAIGVHGAPVDQFSFHSGGGLLDVLVRADSAGDAMWTAEHSDGAVALARIPLDLFGDGSGQLPASRYRALPTPAGSEDAFHNRFVGDYVLYGEGNGWGAPQQTRSVLIVAPLKGGEAVPVALTHPVDRIEAMGTDAVAVGSTASDVIFSSILLGAHPAPGDRYVLQGAAQSETRSHGFFFKPEPPGGNDGVLGLPVTRPATPAYRQLFDASAAILYLRRAEGKFANLGELDSRPETAVDDACTASCVDWYGNARPIFAGGRVFALMGYELVEGRLSRTEIKETGRINFAPTKVAR